MPRGGAGAGVVGVLKHPRQRDLFPAQPPAKRAEPRDSPRYELPEGFGTGPEYEPGGIVPKGLWIAMIDDPEWMPSKP